MHGSGTLCQALRTVALAALLPAAFGAAAQDLPDAPDANAVRVQRAADPPRTFDDALARWKDVDDIAAFAGSAFVYDRARALSLAESGPAAHAGQRAAIHAPDAFFAKPHGVCVDLARFGVETLNRIQPTLQSRYLMLEFEPVVVEGATLRRHWLAAVQREGQWWFFADSRRAGHVAGPYDSVDAFIADYARYRERRIVAWRVTDSYLRRMRANARRAG